MAGGVNECQCDLPVRSATPFVCARCGGSTRSRDRAHLVESLRRLGDVMDNAAGQVCREAAVELQEAVARAERARPYLQEALYMLMSDISEECYCAGWLIDNEFRLWSAVADPADDRQYGMGEIEPEQIAKLKELSELVGGWIVWKDGAQFVPMQEWLAMYAERKGE
jgi:hypothetical protein